MRALNWWAERVVLAAAGLLHDGEVQQLLSVIDRLTVEDSSWFFAWDGQPIDW